MTELTLDASLLSELIGSQLIMGGGGEHAYLAGIAFDGMSNDDSIEDTLIEFMANEESLGLTREEVATIESILR